MKKQNRRTPAVIRIGDEIICFSKQQFKREKRRAARQIKASMDYLFKAVLLLLLSVGLCGAVPPPYKQLPGYHKHNQCYDFSVAFSKACTEANIPAVRLTFDWGALGTTGRHCVVLFRDGGDLWLMDNQMTSPRLVRTALATDLAILKRTGFDDAYQMVSNVTLEPIAPRTLAELFPDWIK